MGKTTTWMGTRDLAGRGSGYTGGEGQGHRGWGWWGVVKEWGDPWADGLYLPEGDGSQAAVAGRMVGWEAKARTRSCPGQTLSRR